MAKVIGVSEAKRSDQSIYDPTCGSGGMLLNSALLVKEKEEMLQKIAKQSEKLDEAKRQENQKYEEIHKVYLDSREKSYEISRDLEQTEKEMIEKEGKDKVDGLKGIDESETEEESGKKAEDEFEEEKGEKKAEDEYEEKMKDKKDGMDAAAFDAKLESFKKTFLKEAYEKDSLAKKLSIHIGTFDSADKTLAEVAEYGVKKLSIPCPKGAEKIALDAYLLNRKPETKVFGLDSAAKTSGKLSAFLKSATGE
jgi:hypothetical protein